MDIKRAKQEIERTSSRPNLAKDAAGNYRIPALRQRPIFADGPARRGQDPDRRAGGAGMRGGAGGLHHHPPHRQSAVGLPFIRERNFDGRTRSVTEYTMSEIIASVYAKMEQTGLRQGHFVIDEINLRIRDAGPHHAAIFAVQDLWQPGGAGGLGDRDGPQPARIQQERAGIRPGHHWTGCGASTWSPACPPGRNMPALSGCTGGKRPIWSCAPQHFYKVEQDVDGAQFVTARGWEDLSAMLQTCDALDLPVDEGLIGQYLRHPEVSRGLCRLLGAVQKVSRGLRRGGHFAG